MHNFFLPSRPNFLTHTKLLKMKNLICWLAILYCLPQLLPAQTSIDTLTTKPNKISIGFNTGYDLNPQYSNDYTFYGTNGGLKLGLTLEYNFKNFGIGLDYDYLSNKSKSLISNILYSDSTLVSPIDKTDISQSISRHFIGIGPNYKFDLTSSLKVTTYLRGGFALIKGGELVTTTPNQTGNVDYQVLFSGVDSKGVGAKGGLNLDYKISNNLALTSSAYYMQHFSVHPDNGFDNSNLGSIGLIYGHSPIINVRDEQAIGSGNPYFLPSPNEEESVPCATYSSIGIELGIKYLFNNKTPKKEICNNCNCPDDGHKVIVTMRDEISGKIIPDADVAIKDLNGNIIATGTTNSYGTADLGEVPHDNYYVTGNIYGIESESTSIAESEFTPDKIIQIEVLYSDMRFLLKGKVTNKGSRSPESNVIVSLTDTKTKDVKQKNSDGQGVFGFPLEKNSSYELIGVKENKLSDIQKATTVGLVRSTTLFVDLELGVENFDCGLGTVLDIKYEYDKDALLDESKFELDKIVRYMMDHDVARIELSSHTDSRGTNEYNQDLSHRRAQAAVSYIMLNGISKSKIIAQGYGETRLLNRCKDGVNCSEPEHRINRRTEAKLLCK